MAPTPVPAPLRSRNLFAALAILLTFASTVVGVAPAGASGFFTGDVVRAHSAEAEILDTINRVRSDVYGLPALENRSWGGFEDYLNCIAQENAANGALNHYPSSCEQGFVEAEILAARYASASGGSVNRLVKQWNESPGHRQIMLSPNANFANVGVFCIGNTSWAIAWIGLDGGSINSNPSPEQPIADSFFTDNDYNCKDSVPVPKNDPLGVHTPADSLESLVLREDFERGDADVLRLYKAFFSRQPDIGGANYWLSLASQGATIDAISGQFAASTEFGNTYGAVSNREYLEILYQNTLGRQPDPSGFNYWLNLLDTGGLDRGGVVRWISANEEFVQNNLYGGL